MSLMTNLKLIQPLSWQTNTGYRIKNSSRRVYRENGFWWKEMLLCISSRLLKSQSWLCSPSPCFFEQRWSMVISMMVESIMGRCFSVWLTLCLTGWLSLLWRFSGYRCSINKGIHCFILLGLLLFRFGSWDFLFHLWNQEFGFFLLITLSGLLLLLVGMNFFSSRIKFLRQWFTS